MEWAVLAFAEEPSGFLLPGFPSATLSGQAVTFAPRNVGTGDSNPPPHDLSRAGKADGFNWNVNKVKLAAAAD